MRKTITLLLLCASLQAAAQDTTGVHTRARQLVSDLAAPEMHGRGYVNSGDSLAAEYIAARFQEAGLLPFNGSRFQPFRYAVNTFPGAMDVRVDGRAMEPGVDFLVHPASGGASGRFDIVPVTPADLADRERRSRTFGVVTGKAVRFERPTTTDADSVALLDGMERELLLYAPVMRKAQGRLIWGVANEAYRNPLIEVAAEAWPDSAGVIELDIAQRFVPRHEARNVWGLVKGRSSKRMVLVTAHYDHLGRMGAATLFPGANDNASGVAMLISLARHFARNKPPCDLLFVAFAGEEAGLVGSRWCVTDRPFDMARVRMVVNLDIMGTGEEGITVVNATAIPREFKLLQDLNARQAMLPQVKSRGPACNSDHCPFVQRGVPGMFIYTLGGVAHYHDVHDRAETLSMGGFNGLYALLVRLIATLK